MTKKLALLFLFFANFVYSQSKDYVITGVIKSENDSTVLQAATIHLEKIKDSSVVTYSISDNDGKFKLEGKTFQKELRLVVSYVGYKSFTKRIKFIKSRYELGTITLKTNKNLLDEIVLKSRAPITIKKDTLEFNVKSFKTKKDANVEDLLKKLPGVEVDAEGKITVNGKSVNKILVNGKPFFGDDPTITTRNLSKEIIEKVQVTDTKTKAEAFAGEKGDDENKTINLTIKEENNKGYFGRLAAGKGQEDLYEFAGIVNRFTNDTRFSVLAGGNNLNSPGFSFGGIQRIFGGGSNFGSGGGITTSQNAGATYADNFGKGFDVNGDYFYSSSNTENRTQRNRETILPDGTSFFTIGNNTNSNENKNNSIKTDFDIEIDSTLLLNIRPSFTFNTRSSLNNQFEESSDDSNTLINQSSSSNFRESKANNFRNRIDLTKKLSSKGSFIKVNLTNQIDNTESESRFNSEVNVFGNNPSTDIRNQESDEASSLNRLSTRITYRYPIIAKKFFIDFKYAFRRDKRENTRNTFDIDPNTSQQIFNTDLSSDFTFFDETSTPTIDITFRKEKWSASLETGIVKRTLENSDKLRPNLSLKRTFNNLELSSNFNYRFSPKASLYSGYRLSNNPPSISQLQPFTDISNPLNIITGNPNLKPSNNHRLYFGFNNFNFQKGTGIYAYASGNFVQNQVVTKSVLDANFIRNTTYENVNGNYSLNASITYSKDYKLDTIKTIKVRFGLGNSRNKSVNFFNNVKYTSMNNTINPNLGVTFTWAKLFEIEPRYFLSKNITNFDIDQFQDQNFTTQNIRIRTKTFAPKRLEWRNDINYRYNPNVAVGFQRSSWFWNSTLAYSMFKDNATLSLKAFDILNQNTNARRSANANFIEDTESKVLSQYFLLSFSWKFNTLGKKAPNNRRSYIIF